MRFVVNLDAAARTVFHIGSKLPTPGRSQRDVPGHGRGSSAMRLSVDLSIRQKPTRIVFFTCGAAILLACSIFAVYDAFPSAHP